MREKPRSRTMARKNETRDEPGAVLAASESALAGLQQRRRELTAERSRAEHELRRASENAGLALLRGNWRDALEKVKGGTDAGELASLESSVAVLDEAIRALDAEVERAEAQVVAAQRHTYAGRVAELDAEDGELLQQALHLVESLLQVEDRRRVLLAELKAMPKMTRRHPTTWLDRAAMLALQRTVSRALNQAGCGDPVGPAHAEAKRREQEEVHRRWEQARKAEEERVWRFEAQLEHERRNGPLGSWARGEIPATAHAVEARWASGADLVNKD